MSGEREGGGSCIIRSNLVTKRSAFKFNKLCVTSHQSDRILSLLREGGVKCKKINKTTNWCGYGHDFIYSIIQKDGLNFVRLHFPNYTWYVDDLHNI